MASGLHKRRRKVVIEPRFENAFLFSDGAAAVEENGKWGIYQSSREISR